LTASYDDNNQNYIKQKSNYKPTVIKTETIMTMDLWILGPNRILLFYSQYFISKCEEKEGAMMIRNTQSVENIEENHRFLPSSS